MNYQMLINKEIGLDENYIPLNLIDVDSKYKDGIKLEAEAYRHWLLLKERVQNEGYIIEIESGYRSYDYQRQVLQNLIDKKGEDYAHQVVAVPGHSEHQTGLAVDYCLFHDNGFIIEYEMREYGVCSFTNNIAHEYGFIVRYPEGKEDITGYQYEPWHLRYVGKDLATTLYEKELSLDEYEEC